jgi:hypothetical protein
MRGRNSKLPLMWLENIFSAISHEFVKHLILFVLHLAHFAHHPSMDGFYAEYINSHIRRNRQEIIITEEEAK